MSRRGFDYVGEDDGDVRPKLGELVREGLALASVESKPEDAEVALSSDAMEVTTGLQHARGVGGRVWESLGHGRCGSEEPCWRP